MWRLAKYAWCACTSYSVGTSRNVIGVEDHSSRLPPCVSSHRVEEIREYLPAQIIEHTVTTYEPLAPDEVEVSLSLICVP